MSAGFEEVRVFSAGLSAPQGAPASRDAVDVLAAQGIDLSKFRSQPLTEDLLEKASHVFVMTREHERLVDMFYPEYIHKVRLLRFDEKGAPDVPDPIGQGREVYAECKRSIEQAMPSILRIINQKPMTTSTEDQSSLSALNETDPEIAAAIDKEYKRQFEHIELIASENFTSRAVMEAQGSCLTNKYAEGYPPAAGMGDVSMWTLWKHSPSSAPRSSSVPSTPTSNPTAAARRTWPFISVF